MLYRRAQIRRPGGGDPADGTAVLLIGAGEDADLFLRALAGDQRRPFRVVGLLALGSRQTGRRIQGHPILGSVDDAPAVLEKLRAEDRACRTSSSSPTHDLAGAPLAMLLEQADQHGLVGPPRPAPHVARPRDPAARRST